MTSTKTQKSAKSSQSTKKKDTKSHSNFKDGDFDYKSALKKRLSEFKRLTDITASLKNSNLDDTKTLNLEDPKTLNLEDPKASNPEDQKASKLDDLQNLKLDDLKNTELGDQKNPEPENTSTPFDANVKVHLENKLSKGEAQLKSDVSKDSDITKDDEVKRDTEHENKIAESENETKPVDSKKKKELESKKEIKEDTKDAKKQEAKPNNKETEVLKGKNIKEKDIKEKDGKNKESKEEPSKKALKVDKKPEELKSLSLNPADDIFSTPNSFNSFNSLNSIKKNDRNDKKEGFITRIGPEALKTTNINNRISHSPGSFTNKPEFYPLNDLPINNIDYNDKYNTDSPFGSNDRHSLSEKNGNEKQGVPLSLKSEQMKQIEETLLELPDSKSNRSGNKEISPNTKEYDAFAPSHLLSEQIYLTLALFYIIFRSISLHKQNKSRVSRLGQLAIQGTLLLKIVLNSTLLFLQKYYPNGKRVLETRYFLRSTNFLNFFGHKANLTFMLNLVHLLTDSLFISSLFLFSSKYFSVSTVNKYFAGARPIKNRAGQFLRTLFIMYGLLRVPLSVVYYILNSSTVDAKMVGTVCMLEVLFISLFLFTQCVKLSVSRTSPGTKTVYGSLFVLLCWSCLRFSRFLNILNRSGSIIELVLYNVCSALFLFLAGYLTEMFMRRTKSDFYEYYSGEDGDLTISTTRKGMQYYAEKLEQ